MSHLLPTRLATFATALALLGLASLAPLRVAQGQLLDTPTTANPARFAEADVVQFRVGAEITAKRGACRNIRVMVAVPLECDEQAVQIVSEDFSQHVSKVIYRNLDGGARQMLIHVPRLGDGETARAIVTFEVRTKPILPPEDDEAASLVIPKKLDRSVRKFLAPSPFIETRSKEVRTLARQLWKEAGEATGDTFDNTSASEGEPEGEPSEPTDWKKIEYLYDYMLDNIKYVEGPDKSAVTTLRDGKADCHGRSAVFVALCRANKVPARVVWVNNHCYAEFYLEDAEGEGAWYPAESAGSRAFGEMPLARTILQKGDNFKIPERPKERLRYASDFLIGVPVGNAGQPKAKFIREELE